jgi:cytochrome P450
LQFRPFPADVVQKVGSLSAFFLDSYQRTGSIYRFNRGGKSFVVLSGVEANQFMNCDGHQYIYAQEYRQEQNEELGIEKNLVSMTGDEHHHFRKLHKRGYSRSALNPKYPELVELTQKFAQQWPQDERIPVTEVMPRLIAEQLGVGVINYPLGDYFDDVVTFVRTVTIETVARIRPRQVLDTDEYKQAKTRSLELADKILDAHRGCPMHQREPDVIDDLLDALGDDDDFMTEQELRIAALGGYIGGLDTVAYTCAFMLYELLKDPELLAEITAEIDTTIATDGLTPQSLKKMPCLRAATLETLRLYPVSPAIQGTVYYPFEFAGYQVHAGQEIIVGVTVPHHLPEYYPDPFTFDIGRYSHPRNEHRQAGAFAPFGIGEHLCLGAGMAETFIQLTLAALLHTVRLELDPPDYTLAISALPTPKPDNFFVRVVERKM